MAGKMTVITKMAGKMIEITGMAEKMTVTIEMAAEIGSESIRLLRSTVGPLATIVGCVVLQRMV